MTPTQEHLLKLMVEFDEICRRHNIDYFLEAGTCLGAVRHKGFIPWDNDLDVAMTEPNYNKFVEVCAVELDGVTRTFADGRTNREWPTSFGHYIDLTTCRISNYSVYWDNLCGQSIDVFCYVELPGDLQENARISNLYFAYDEYLNRSFNHYRRKTPAIYQLYHQMLDREKTEGREAVLKDAESQIFGHSYADANMLMCNSARMHWTTFMPKKPFDSYKEVEFEGHMFMVPGDWYEIMVCNYGDDFGLYPKDRTEAHKDMSHKHIPAKVYVEDALTAIDKPKMFADRLAHREAELEAGYKDASTIKDFHMAQGCIERERLKKRMAASPKTLTQLMDENSLEAVSQIEELLGTYFDAQINSSSLYWHAHFGAGDDVDEAVVYLLMARGNSHKIDIFMGMRLHNGLVSSPRMKALRNTALKMREARKLWHYDQLGEGRAQLEEARNEMPPVRMLDTWDLLYRYKEAGEDASSSEYEDLCSAASALLEDNPACGRCLMVKAHCLRMLGRFEEARAICQQLEKEGDNGFILSGLPKFMAQLDFCMQGEAM